MQADDSRATAAPPQRERPGGRESGSVLPLTATALLCLVAGCGQQAPPNAPEDRATVRINAADRLNPVSDLLYGQFAEFMFENIKGGMWAELLVNRGFEDTAPPPAASHYWERYPDNRNHANGFHLDGSRLGLSEQGYPATYENRAQLLVNTLAEQQGHGIYQARIPVRDGILYHGSAWVRAMGIKRAGSVVQVDGAFSGSVRVSLEEDRSGGKAYAFQDLENISTDWSRFEFQLAVTDSDPLARFAISVQGTGAIWIDQISLMPGDALDGVRADVLEKIQELHPAFVRWPGGNVAQDYHWEWGIGPRDERPTWVNMSWDNDPEPSDFGTLEFLRFCQSIDAEPNIVVNAEGRGATVGEALSLASAGRDIRRDSRPATADEAASWVEYANGAAATKAGALRARDGHPEPFGVEFWEIGNEIWGDWVRGHSDAETYAANARRYIRAMRAVDPAIKIIAVGDEDPEWNRTVLREIGEEIDLLSIHHYRPKPADPTGFGALMARPLLYERFYDSVRDMIREIVPGREIGVALNEWNTTFGTPRQHTMESALYGARLMNVFERQGDLIQMSAVSDLVNGWPGGVIQASRHDVFTTATYSVIEAYNRNRGDWRVRADVECDVFHEIEDASIDVAVPVLDVAASTSDAGDVLYVKVVNSSERAMSATLELGGVAGDLGRQAKAWTVTAPDLTAHNSFSDPEVIKLLESVVDVPGPRFLHEFPRFSVTVIRLDVL